jgi:hypothetical protein
VSVHPGADRVNFPPSTPGPAATTPLGASAACYVIGENCRSACCPSFPRGCILSLFSFGTMGPAAVGLQALESFGLTSVAISMQTRVPWPSLPEDPVGRTTHTQAFTETGALVTL